MPVLSPPSASTADQRGDVPVALALPRHRLPRLNLHSAAGRS